MNNARLNSLLDEGVAFDLETHVVQRGLLAPPLVCGSSAWFVDGEVPRIDADIHDKAQALQTFLDILGDPRKVMVGANIAFDELVASLSLAKTGRDVMPLLFQALEEGRVFDLQLAEALNAVAEGHLGKDPRTGGPLVNPETGRRGRYSLATCVDLVLGRKDAKANDEWRMRYAELEGIPMSDWPPTAIDYPKDDARNTLECALAQAGLLPKLVNHHDWGPTGACRDCGATAMGVPCLVTRRHRNLHDLSNQVGTHYVLHAGSAWGFNVDQSLVDVIERHALARRATGLTPFVTAGLVRDDGSENRSELKRRVAVAYGARTDQTCPTCAGTGKVPSPANPRNQIICFSIDSVGQKTKTCDGTGLVLGNVVPRSDKDGISYGRDVLHESGDEFLMAYGDHLEDSKTLDVYVPYLRMARSCKSCGSSGTEKDPHREGCNDQIYKNIPLTLRPNVILETGRVSYDGVIQLFPRKPGHIAPETGEWVPSLRECVVARPRHLFSSEDFKAGELYTHAQSCIWITGDSDLARALLLDVDPHSALAATVLGVTYEEFIRRKKEPKFKNARQAAKPFTFGKPGGMGSVKLVQQQRKQGPDTPCDGGPLMVDDGAGGRVPGFKGLRFCILMNNAPSCGRQKVTVWGRNEQSISPTCRECLECADVLGEAWRRQWRENAPYFKFINECIEEGMVITPAAIARWPHLAEVYDAGTRLAPGEIMQHYSGRIRGGLDYCSAANSFFQALLGDISKEALRVVGRECFDKTVRVPSMYRGNSLPSAYAGGPSPLYGSRPVGFFHDELFIEHPEDQAHDGATRTSEIMRDVMRWACPDVAATCAADPTLMRAWFKQAECTRDKSGRLIPWEPKR